MSETKNLEVMNMGINKPDPLKMFFEISTYFWAAFLMIPVELYNAKK